MKINFPKFKKEKKLTKDNTNVNVNFYWKLLLYAFLLFLVSSVAFGFYVFSNTNKEPVLSDTIISKQNDKVKQSRVDNVFNYFTEKTKKTDDILNSTVSVVDPSL